MIWQTTSITYQSFYWNSIIIIAIITLATKTNLDNKTSKKKKQICKLHYCSSII